MASEERQRRLVALLKELEAAVEPVKQRRPDPEEFVWALVSLPAILLQRGGADPEAPGVLRLYEQLIEVVNLEPRLVLEMVFALTMVAATSLDVNWDDEEGR